MKFRVSLNLLKVNSLRHWGVVLVMMPIMLVLAPQSLWADVRSRIYDVKEGEAAKQRLYPGGVDEEDLQVQTSLPSAERRMDTATLRTQVLRESRRQAPSQAPAPAAGSADEAEDGN